MEKNTAMNKPNSELYDEVFRHIADNSEAETLPPKLYFVPTPIGNIGDIGLRALTILNGVSEIYCEDTRNSLKLLNMFHISAKTDCCHQHNEMQRAEEMCRKVAAGIPIAYISDAGSPGISDPGERIVKYFIEQNMPFEVLPGANAVLPAWLTSGLPTDKLYFCGFLPRSGTERIAAIEQIRKVQATSVIYESPLRVGSTLTELYKKLGERPASLIRELTKYYEEAVRGKLSTLSERFNATPPKGECIIVVGRGEAIDEGNEKAFKLIKMLIDTGCTAADSARIAATTFEKPRNAMYKYAVEYSKCIDSASDEEELSPGVTD